MKHFILSLILLTSGSVFANNDEMFDRQWGHDNTGQTILRADGTLTRDRIQGTAGVDINWVKPTDLKVKGNQVVVAVIDSGFDLNHPDLKDRTWFNEKECKGKTEEEMAKLPCFGWSFIDGNSNLEDDNGHGTHVAGIIAALHNDIGIAGVAGADVKIMPLKIFNRELSEESQRETSILGPFFFKGRILTEDVIADAIAFAVQNGADVINISAGWPRIVHGRKTATAIALAQQNGVLIVAATGNNNKDVPIYPCTSEGVLCVGAIDNKGKLTEFTNHGGKVDLLAPGEDIVSTHPLNLESRSMRVQGYETKRGSSQAAPYISAIAAIIKSQYPEASPGEIKARLYQTAGLSPEENGRFSVQGLVNMKAALEVSPKPHAEPSFKSILEVQVRPSGRFALEIPFRGIYQTSELLDIEVKIEGPQVSLRQNKFQVKRLDENKIKTIKLLGDITSWQGDSHGLLKIKVKNGDLEKTYQTALVFSRDLAMDPRLKKTEIPGMHPDLISVFRGANKTTRLRRIGDKHLESEQIEWTFIDPREQEDKTRITIISHDGEQVSVKKLELTKTENLVGVFRRDVNLDGKSDYFVYTIDPKDQMMHFDFFNQDGSPVFEGSLNRWDFPVTTFQGLPLRGNAEDFKWLKKKVEGLGEVLVPVIERSWYIPEQDNTDHPLDRLPNQQKNRLYYLNPVVKEGKVEVEIRLINGYSFISQVTEKFNLLGIEEITLSSPLSQELGSIKNGKLSAVLAIGEEFTKSNYILEFDSPETFNFRPLVVSSSQIADNTHFDLYNLRNESRYSSSNIFVALINRQRVRMGHVDYYRQEYNKIYFESGLWSDPVFNLLGGFESDETVETILESRNFVHYVTRNRDGSLESQRLPINRDSSFPGSQFAETIRPVVWSQDGAKNGAIYVDSTLIFGDRLYIMTKEEEKFTRPLSMSVQMPKSCVNLGPAIFKQDGQAYFAMMCKDGPRKSTIGLYPVFLEK